RLAARLGLGSDGAGGVLLIEIEAGGPADRAGLDDSDVIIEFGNRPISGIDDLHRLLTEERVGERTPMLVLRNGEVVPLEIIPGEAGHLN
ncbi:PDZ domain-containing protein, partial [Singulisphaera rosea]